MSENIHGASTFVLRRSLALERLVPRKLYKAAGLSLVGAAAAAGTAATIGSLSSHHPEADTTTRAAPSAPAPVPSPPPPAPAPAPKPAQKGLLSEGSSGPEVAKVQRALGISADGVFGPKTRSAVIGFQQSHGLVADGIVGPKTSAALAAPKAPASHASHAVAAKPASSSPSASANTTGAAAVVRWAFSEIGKPYSYGASGPSAFDCSGLTSYVFRQAQISLPRTSQAQFQSGKAVDRSNIKPGDLVFWNTDGAGASHVGIAISPTEAISAGTSQGVRTHPINSGYWGSHYVGARSEF